MNSLKVDLDHFNSARESFLRRDISGSVHSLGLIKSYSTKELIEELTLQKGNMNLLDSARNNASNKLMGVFDCPYHPYLSLEISEIQDISPSIRLEGYSSQIRSVIQLQSSPGLGNEQVVAVFPENLRSVEAQAQHPVYYFVDKFAARHKKYSYPLLLKIKYFEFFRILIDLSQQELYPLIANWVNIHELSHRQGVLPIPENLKVKSGKFTAALEELRADLLAIKTCLELNGAKYPDGERTAVYIFGERLLAYPLFRDKYNFDTISSIILWKFLNDNEFFQDDLNLVKLYDLIAKLVLKIDQTERESLLYPTAIEKRAFIQGRIQDFLINYESAYSDYFNFWNLK